MEKKNNSKKILEQLQENSTNILYKNNTKICGTKF